MYLKTFIFLILEKKLLFFTFVIYFWSGITIINGRRLECYNANFKYVLGKKTTWTEFIEDWIEQRLLFRNISKEYTTISCFDKQRRKSDSWWTYEIKALIISSQVLYKWSLIFYTHLILYFWPRIFKNSQNIVS